MALDRIDTLLASKSSSYFSYLAVKPTAVKFGEFEIEIDMPRYANVRGESQSWRGHHRGRRFIV